MSESRPTMDHLDQLEQQSVFIFREAFRHFERLCMLWSIGKDSTVLLWLARKAFFGHVPFPLVHIDTSYKLPEMIRYRDTLAMEYKLQMVVGQNKAALAEKDTFPDKFAANPNMSAEEQAQARTACCGRLKTDALAATLHGTGTRMRLNLDTGKYELIADKLPYTGVIVGARVGRGGEPLEGALLLAARQARRLGRRRSAARVLEPVQDRLRAGHAPAHPPAARLDRAEHLGVHQAREHPDRVAVLRPGRRHALPQPRLRSLPARRSTARRRTSTTSSPN